MPAFESGKTFIFGSIAIFLSVVVSVAVLELGLRFAPVSSGLRDQDVTAENPVFHFQPDSTMTYSRGWDFRVQNTRHINNAGWVNDQDYVKEQSPPLLAVIGDSYVEAAMVSYPETMYGRLADKLKGTAKVYSFGASGAPLSQYLIWARLAVQEFGAQALVINVVGNDFDESHAAYSTGPGWWVYAAGIDGSLRLHLVEYRPGWLRRVASKSALARYVFFNLQFTNTWREILSFLFPSPANAAARYAGNTDVDTGPERMTASNAVVGAFFRDLPELVGLRPEQILFCVDGFRYREALPRSDSYFGRMRNLFIEQARSRGYGVIDLDPLFFANFAQHHERFEDPEDGHWNQLGHQVAAEAVFESELVASFKRSRASEPP